MKTCICNIAWSPEEDQSVYEMLRDLDIDAIEVAPTRIFPQMPYNHLQDAILWKNHLYSEWGLNVASVMSICYGRSENIFYSEDERDFLMDYCKSAIDFSENLGAFNVVFGCPKNRNGYQKLEVNYQTALEFFEEIGDYAFRHNTIVGLEANPTIYGTDFLNTTEEAIEFLRIVNSKGLKLNLDVGTILCNNEALDVLGRHLELVNHVHISEPYMRKIMEHPIHAELANLLRDHSFPGYISVEMGCLNTVLEVKQTMEYVRMIFE